MNFFVHFRREILEDKEDAIKLKKKKSIKKRVAENPVRKIKTPPKSSPVRNENALIVNPSLI